MSRGIRSLARVREGVRVRSVGVRPWLILAALAVLPLDGRRLSAQADPPGTPPTPADTAQAVEPLTLEDVLESVEATYPPLLKAMIEQEVRDGRLRSARGVFDLDLMAKASGTPDGYYEYSTVEAAAEQFLGIWGSTIYGGYRLTDGETLPDYYTQRTQGDGEATVGLRLPLLRGGPIDKFRAAISQAELDALAADPFIARQRLDFVRAASVSYFKWLASGRKLVLARELLRLANERTAALQEQVANGLQPEIVLVDNQRLVVSRELAVIAAERDFQGAALSLSLFFRDASGQPIVPGEERLPADFPAALVPQSLDVQSDLDRALERRPELVRLDLEIDRVEVDVALARNTLLPSLDANVEAADNFGEDLYVDRSRRELRAGVAFKLPLQRREARGKVQETEAKLSQLEREAGFARDKVVTEVQDAFVALTAAAQQTERAQLNVELALELQAAEQELFRLGSSDLLAVQIREQAAFDAQSKAVEAFLDFFTAVADYRAAVAEGVPPFQMPGS